MAVAPLQLPGYAAPTTIDWTPLDQLGNQIVQNRKQAATAQALSSLGRTDGGKIDVTPLLQSGDMSLANLGIQIQNRKQDQERLARQDERQAKNDEFSHNIQTQQLAISRQNADRLNASPEDTASGRARAAIANGIQPGTPEFKSYVLTGSLGSTVNQNPHVVNMGGALVDNRGQVLYKSDANTTLDPTTIDTMADQYIAGDKSVLQNLGRGQQGAANLVALRNSIAKRAGERGLDGNGLAQGMISYAGDLSRERTAGTQEGRMASAGIEAQGAVNLAQKASDAVPRGSFVPVNQLLQMGQQSISDPSLRAFQAANTTLINTYARAINPNGVGTVADKEHARQMLSTADGPEAYKAVLNQMRREIEMAHQSPVKARGAFQAERQQRMTGQPQTQSQNDPLGIR